MIVGSGRGDVVVEVACDFGENGDLAPCILVVVALGGEVTICLREETVVVADVVAVADEVDLRLILGVEEYRKWLIRSRIIRALRVVYVYVCIVWSLLVYSVFQSVLLWCICVTDFAVS